jgi:nickel transport protein
LLQSNRLSLHIHIAVLVALCTACSANRVYAHKVTIHAWTTSDRVVTESYFPDGRAVINATVSVFGSNEILLLSGETDQDGMFSFPIPEPDDVTIVLDAAAGHRASVSLSKEQLARPSTTAAQNGISRILESTIIRVCIGIACIGGISGIAMLAYRRKKK